MRFFYSLSKKKMFALTFYYTIVNALELEAQITFKIYFQWHGKLVGLLKHKNPC